MVTAGRSTEAISSALLALRQCISSRRWQLGDLPWSWLMILPSLTFPLVRVRRDGALSRKSGCGFAVRPLTLAIPLGWSDESSAVRDGGNNNKPIDLEEELPMFRTSAAVLALVLLPSVAAAQPRCDRVLAQLSGQLVDAVCFESADLTTTNAATTPANNSIPTLPAGAFTPQTDRATIAPSERQASADHQVVPGSRSRRGSRTTRPTRVVSCCDCRTTGTASSSSRARRARAASSTATSPGATSSSRRAMRTPRRTRAC